ncbi:hypothetical protein J6590_078943 [Homalodisca vitripennis]|nr:hypothetical protein J6590_078943 [Homalodisca vitripennis]
MASTETVNHTNTAVSISINSTTNDDTNDNPWLLALLIIIIKLSPGQKEAFHESSESDYGDEMECGLRRGETSIYLLERRLDYGLSPLLTFNLGTNGLKVTSEPPPTAGQAGCLQGQDRSAVTHPSSSHARHCLISR